MHLKMKAVGIVDVKKKIHTSRRTTCEERMSSKGAVGMNVLALAMGMCSDFPLLSEADVEGTLCN